MGHVFIDFETKSEVDLTKVGSDSYSQHMSTDCLCIAFAFDDEPVQLWTPKDPRPERLLDFVAKNKGEIIGHNIGGFEVLIWNNVMGLKYDWPEIKIEQCRDTMAMAYAMSLPGNLNDAALSLGLAHTKDMRGHRVMLQLSQPRSYVGNVAVWWDETEVPEKYQALYDYCKQDVEVERSIYNRLMKLPPLEQKLWELDWRINRVGVGIDTKAVASAIKVVEFEKERINQDIRRITNGAVWMGTATGQLTDWLKRQGLEVPSVAKADVLAMLEKDIPEKCRKVLLLRQEVSKTSTAKLQAMVEGASCGNRIRGLFQYHGASTGRWAGRRVQLQNLKRPDLSQEKIDEAFSYLNDEAPMEKLKTIGNPMTVISDCVRGFLVPKTNHHFLVCDFSSIEARVLAWLAGEEKVLDIFRTHGKIYEHAAAGIYNVAIDDIKKSDPRRQVGKVAILALGYGGGVGAFQTMAKAYGVIIPDDQAENIKLAWRESNRNIVAYWYALDKAAMTAVANPKQKCAAGEGSRKVIFLKDGSFLWCRLPSGRALCYPYPKLDQVLTPWGEERQALTYMSVDSFSHKWERTKTYGGKLAENLTQAVARDILSNSIFELEKNGYPVVAHVHDEIIVEASNESSCTIQTMESILSIPPAWAKDLPLAASGFKCLRYRK